MSKNPQHDRVKPRGGGGGGQGPFTQCVKNIRFGRGWLPLALLEHKWNLLRKLQFDDNAMRST